MSTLVNPSKLMNLNIVMLWKKECHFVVTYLPELLKYAAKQKLTKFCFFFYHEMNFQQYV